LSWLYLLKVFAKKKNKVGILKEIGFAMVSAVEQMQMKSRLS